MSDLVKKVMLKITADDGDAEAKLAAISAKADELGRKHPEIKVRIDAAAASAKIAVLRKELKGAGEDAQKSGGIFSRIFGRLGSIGGGIGNVGSTLGSIGSAASPFLIGGAAALAASMVPALLPMLLGGAVGAAGIGGAFLASGFLQKQIFSQQALLNSIQRLQAGKLTPANRATLALDQARYAAGVPVGQLEALYQPLAGFQNTVQNVGGTALLTFAKAIVPVLAPVSGMLSQLGKFIQGMGPQLGQLFQASLPFLKAFLTILEQGGKAILPAMTQSLKQMTPYIPMMVKGFVALTQGLADFLKDLGPGMKASAIIFETSGQAIKGILIGLSYAVDVMAIGLVKSVEMGKVAIRALEVAWDDAYRAVRGAIIGVINYVKSLPGQIMSALAALPGMLFSAGAHAIDSLLMGFLSKVPAIGNVVGGIAHKVAGFFGLSPAKEGPLSGAGAPLIRGQHFAQDIARGIMSQIGAVSAAAGQLATAAALGPGRGPALAGAGAGFELRLEVPGGAEGALYELLFQHLKLMVREKGGGDKFSAQRAWGQVWR